MPDDQPGAPSPQQPMSSGDRGAVLRRTQSFAWTGPLPPPDILRAYENLLPGSAERIIAMAEKQSEHRRGIEKIVINSGATNQRWGVVFGFIIAIMALLLAGYALYEGRSQTGTAIVITTIGSLAGVFIVGKYLTARERAGRDDSRDVSG